MTPFSVLACGPEYITKAIEAGDFTLEQMEDALNEYEEFVAQISTEWPATRIRTFLEDKVKKELEFYRTQKAWAENENHVARQRGVSYKGRAGFVEKIQACDKLIAEGLIQLNNYNQYPLYSAKRYIQPDEMDAVRNRGFEKHLNVVRLVDGINT
jgi:hypothetical protein